MACRDEQDAIEGAAVNVDAEVESLGHDREQCCCRDEKCLVHGGFKACVKTAEVSFKYNGKKFLICQACLWAHAAPLEDVQ